jgi:putative transposase
VEAIVADTIRKRFLSRQKRSVAVIHREIRQACVARGLLVCRAVETRNK